MAATPAEKGVRENLLRDCVISRRKRRGDAETQKRGDAEKRGRWKAVWPRFTLRLCVSIHRLFHYPRALFIQSLSSGRRLGVGGHWMLDAGCLARRRRVLNLAVHRDMAKPLRAAPLSAKLHSGRFPNFGELMRRRNARRILPVSASTVHHPTPCEPSPHCSSHLSAGRTWSRDHRDPTKR